MTSVLKSDMNYRFLLLFEKEICRGCLLSSTFPRRASEGSFLATALETRQLRETSLEKQAVGDDMPRPRRVVASLTSPVSTSNESTARNVHAATQRRLATAISAGLLPRAPSVSPDFVLRNLRSSTRRSTPVTKGWM